MDLNALAICALVASLETSKSVDLFIEVDAIKYRELYPSCFLNTKDLSFLHFLRTLSELSLYVFLYRYEKSPPVRIRKPRKFTSGKL
jgi:hypothetical protein